MLDTRRHLNKLINYRFKIPLKNALSKFIFSLLFAFVLTYFPSFSLEQDALYMLFILLFAACLWVSEAIPAFSVSLLIIGLEIILIGFTDFDFSKHNTSWKYFLQPWSSPLVFLFLGGFIMAIAASKTKLDLWLAKKMLFYVGDKPENILSGLMIITFVLSMFISNTATTAMMITVTVPILASMKKDNKFQKAILLAVVVAANIGGMSTIIGTPPNAIAVGALGVNAPSFVSWMYHALPPAIVAVIILRYIIIKLYPSNEEKIIIKYLEEVSHYDDSTTDFSKVPSYPSWKKALVILVLLTTVSLWLTGPLHHIPTTVVSFLPIIVLTIFGIIDVEDIKEIRWDVIILIIGGLSLGLGVVKTGLDTWLASLIDFSGFSVFLLVLVFSYIVVLVSNFMSNTAATNILLPLIIAISSSFTEHLSTFAVIAVALCASFAMTLPVSTPPNAIMYSSGKLQAKDFLSLGVIIAILGPLLVLSWLYLIY